jgi:hypothetical protein
MRLFYSCEVSNVREITNMVEFNDHSGNFSVNVNNLNIDSKKIIYFNYAPGKKKTDV